VGRAGGGGGGYAPIGRQPYQTPGMGSRIAPAMNSRAAAQPADYPPRGYGQMDRGYAPAAPHRPYGNPQAQQGGGYGPWTR
uniref:Uncharacterized protein n=1 Tax=Plectus sambesii TaxID=2011161 RepID=A0A914V8B6_9BILA